MASDRMCLIVVFLQISTLSLASIHMFAASVRSRSRTRGIPEQEALRLSHLFLAQQVWTIPCFVPPRACEFSYILLVLVHMGAIRRCLCELPAW